MPGLCATLAHVAARNRSAPSVDLSTPALCPNVTTCTLRTCKTAPSACANPGLCPNGTWGPAAQRYCHVSGIGLLGWHPVPRLAAAPDPGRLASRPTTRRRRLPTSAPQSPAIRSHWLPSPPARPRHADGDRGERREVAHWPSSATGIAHLRMLGGSRETAAGAAADGRPTQAAPQARQGRTAALTAVRQRGDEKARSDAGSARPGAAPGSPTSSMRRVLIQSVSSRPTRPVINRSTGTATEASTSEAQPSLGKGDDTTGRDAGSRSFRKSRLSGRKRDWLWSFTD